MDQAGGLNLIHESLKVEEKGRRVAQSDETGGNRDLNQERHLTHHLLAWKMEEEGCDPSNESSL